MFRHALDTKCVKRIVLLALISLVACTPNETPRPTASPTGPPTIQAEAIEAHARQFEEELPERTAGSQQEFAAATYITAHLQQAGYVVEFDSVPVANTVRSTNVVALPPSTEDPEYLVTVAYDEGSDEHAIGVFLELARSLNAAQPGHSVQFAAVGAENAEVEGGDLGSRRMIKLLLDRELEPEVIAVDGSLATKELYEAAGFEYRVLGSGAAVAEETLEFLIANAG